MRTIKKGSKRNIKTCSNAQGNGANWHKCKINGLTCPYQHWCNQKRIYEMLGTAEKCPNYNKKQ